MTQQLKRLSTYILMLVLASFLGCASTAKQEGTGEYFDDTVITATVKAAVLNEPTLADDFSHECVDIAVDWGISGQYVTRLLDRAAIFRGTRWPYAPTTVQSSPAGRSWPGRTATVFATS